MSLKINNLEQVKKDFIKFSKVKETEMIKELEITAFEIETEAKRKLTIDNHVVSGNLRSSVHVVKQNDKIPVHFKPTERYVGTDVPYAEKIELLPDGGYLAYAANMKAPRFRQRIQKILAR